jgi:hypothetical protein
MHLTRKIFSQALKNGIGLKVGLILTCLSKRQLIFIGQNQAAPQLKKGLAKLPCERLAFTTSPYVHAVLL